MNPLKVIPIVASIGLLAVAGAKALAELIDEEISPSQSETKEAEKPKYKTVTENDIKISSAAQLIYNRAIKKTQNELARAYDIKMLNDRLENTGQIDKVVISINEKPITNHISLLEVALDKYIAQLNKFKNA